MADKSFIEFRLDPDNIKEELSQLIPYYETLKYYHENPDAPISETAKVAAQETPILGSILRGEPVNAAEEAFIMGLTPTKIKAINEYVKKHPNAKYENIGNEIYDIGVPDTPRGTPRVYKPGLKGNFFQEEMDRVTNGEPYFMYKNTNDFLNDLNESAKITSSNPYTNNNNYIKKANELDRRLFNLNDLKNNLIKSKDNNLPEYDIWDAGEYKGTVNQADYDRVLSNLDLEIKKTMADINKHKIEMEFAPEFEQYKAPQFDEKSKSFFHDILNKEYEYYLDATKNMKYPYQK